MVHIAILGRPNVGKSTLFNRLIRKRKSIVAAMPGVTRDVNREIISIDNENYTFYDTGGLLDKSDDTLNSKVHEASLKTAAGKADILIFVADAKEEHPDDRHFINRIRKFNKPIILAVNKVDSKSHQNMIYNFAELGIKDTVAISAEHGTGIGELLEKVEEVSKLINKKNEEIEKDTEKEITIAIAGKPNTGKSTLLNSIIGEDRSIVSSIAGTTRDAIDAHINFDGVNIKIVDTAGIRKKKNVDADLEYYSVNRAVSAIEKADVVILMLNVLEGLTEQDKKIAGLVVDRRKGIIIAANKWDLREKNVIWSDYEAYMKNEFPVLSYAFYTKVTATKEADAKKLLSLAIRAAKTRLQRFETHALTQMLVRATREYTITAGAAPFKIFYVTQINVNPPMFSVFCNHPDKLNNHYKRYLENKLREVFDFRGTPIVLQYRKRSGEKVWLK